MMRELGIENFDMQLIKCYNVFDRQHLRAYEQLWINKLNSINIIGAIAMSHTKWYKNSPINNYIYI
jgi:hypothetical protein